MWWWRGTRAAKRAGPSRALRLTGVVCAVVLTAVVLTAGALTAIGGTAGTQAGEGTGSAPPNHRAAGASRTARAVTGTQDASVARLQDRLGRVPGDWPAWAELGLAYVELARRTGDPTSYPRAESAFARSLALRPEGNDTALAGRAALAAARHDFPGALRAADAAIAVNPFNATAHGVRFDALVELGRYPEAWPAAQTAVDLRPDVASLARVAYAYELRGQPEPAAETLRRVIADATSPADAAFACFHLGELARNRGDLDGAADAYRRGLVQDPSSVQLLVGRARVAAARGEIEAALADYRVATTRSPQPWIVAEHGELLEAAGRMDEARRQYDLVRSTAALLRAQGVEVDVELALFEADHGEPATAWTALAPPAPSTAPDTGLGTEPRRAGVFVDDARGWVLHRLGRDDEALASADSALGLGLRRALFLYHRGVVRAALGQTDAAISDLRTALETDPHFSPLHVPRARTLLTSLEGGTR
ncbi:Tetratricopeptide repeat-containing protein [Parafrankia irregularis]|uniref:Tetratricopeptide repeat-containing protein n=1 Tax=Parafrankia irregularis TaxID=795642 RepID=A0A0S4QMQ9_9ACTN|nr:tetratricopeptide repeat protein [Parafrankia sp. CH37]CUU56955.1 Tetratricopeptide repeat-containing protein [Parafrankia irregularis]